LKISISITKSNQGRKELNKPAIKPGFLLNGSLAKLQSRRLVVHANPLLQNGNSTEEKCFD
jgi:hypothetical protein